MLRVVTWKWNTPGYRSSYGPAQVNVLRSMVARHYPDPHEFICCTDDPTGLDSRIRFVPLWNDFADLGHPSGPRYPSCYRRLRAFDPDIGQVFGDRFVSLDLDCVIVDDLRPLWNRPEAFVGWHGTHARNSFNGSMFLMTAGARPQVWTEFNPRKSPERAQRAGYYGTDQAWISCCLGSKEARWSDADGVLSYRLHVAPAAGRLLPNARVIFWNGKSDPWGEESQRLDWVRDNWR